MDWASMSDLLVLFAGGFLAGILGGLLGIGGGVVLMPLLRFVVSLSPAHAAGTCIVAVFFTTLGGSYRHCRLGHVRIQPIVPIIVSGALATTLFSFIFQRIARQGHWLDLGIGIVFCSISIRMILEGIRRLPKSAPHSPATEEIRGTLPQKIAIGSLAGALPGLLGIGTGVILVPAFNMLLRAPIKVATACSLVCFCFNALISSTFKLAQGFVDLQVALPICVGTLVGANLGAILNKRFAPRIVKLLFGLAFSYIALKFVLSFCWVTK
jgi:uncharacterized membrane protein YfcA